MKKLNKNLIITLLAFLCFFAFAFAAYTGEHNYGSAIIGVDYNGTTIMFGTATSGQASPTGGGFPVFGKDASGNAYALYVDSTGGLKITAADFSGTLGTTAPTKGAQVYGKDASGYLQALKVDSTGRLFLATDGTVGSAAPTSAVLVGVSDGTNMRAIAADTGGQIKIIAPDYGSTIGSTTFGAKGINIVGTDGTTARQVKTDSGGAVQTDIESGSITAVTGCEFSATSGTTTGYSKVVVGAGLNGGVPTAIEVDSSGYQGVNVKNTPAVTLTSTTLTSVTGCEFSATSGTTDGKGSKIVQIGGSTGGVPYAWDVDSSGYGSVNIKNTPAVTLASTTLTSVTGCEFSATSGTTDGKGAKGVQILGNDGTNPRNVKVTTNGAVVSDNVSVCSWTLTATGSNAAATATKAGGGAGTWYALAGVALGWTTTASGVTVNQTAQPKLHITANGSDLVCVGVQNRDGSTTSAFPLTNPNYIPFNPPLVIPENTALTITVDAGGTDTPGAAWVCDWSAWGRTLSTATP